MKKRFYILIIILLSNYQLSAQNSINTDRPDQSDGTHIIEKNHVQIETGVQFSKLDELTKSFDNTTLIRFGATRHFEVRLLNQYSTISNNNNSISGFKPIAISFKNQLCNQKGFLPKITLVTYFRIPITINSEFEGKHLGYTFTLAGRHDITSKLKLYSNIGITRDQEKRDISYLSTLEINYNVTDKLSSFIEYFGNYQLDSVPSNGLDIGFIYALRNNFAIDTALGSAITTPNNKFISFGCSFRLPK